MRASLYKNELTKRQNKNSAPKLQKAPVVPQFRTELDMDSVVWLMRVRKMVTSNPNERYYTKTNVESDLVGNETEVTIHTSHFKCPVHLHGRKDKKYELIRILCLTTLYAIKTYGGV
jgi:hypothetical protein